MKSIVRIIWILLIVIFFAGCYRQVSKETVVPIEVKVVDMDAPMPSQNEADIIIVTHIKKASYHFSPRAAETPYTFTILIDCNELKESLKGIEVVESKIVEERGKGIHYTLKKRLRLKPGSYVIVLKSEDGPSAKIKIKLSGGKIHTLIFDPIYGPPKFGRPKHFREGIVDYEVNWDEERY